MLHKLQQSRVLDFLSDFVGEGICMENEMIDVVIQEVVKVDHIIIEYIRK